MLGWPAILAHFSETQRAWLAKEGIELVIDFVYRFKDGQECAKQMGTDDATWTVALWQAAKAVAEGITDAAATDLIVAARFRGLV